VAITAPIMLIVALVVRFGSPGPILFRQSRIGLNGSMFTLYKFRSMRADAEAKTGAVWASKNDPRVTANGRWLRKLRLDELPQLFNVLAGSMSLVGPRPVLPWEAEMFDPVHLRRFEVKPGITGLWQIRGRSKLGMREALDLDVEYVLRRSIARDLFILVMTVPALFRGGAS
jgi:lipopolysaccharide/colanic/teichoic acid biosynthesis glycosyltransferase